MRRDDKSIAKWVDIFVDVEFIIVDLKLNILVQTEEPSYCSCTLSLGPKRAFQCPLSKGFTVAAKARKIQVRAYIYGGLIQGR